MQLPRTFHPADMRKVEEALRRCEEREVSHLSSLVAGGPDIEQLSGQGVRSDLISTTGSVAYFVLPPTLGPYGADVDGLPHEIDAVLSTERMQSKLSKLAASGQAERHLFSTTTARYGAQSDRLLRRGAGT